jgi:hypothetical protein
MLLHSLTFVIPTGGRNLFLPGWENGIMEKKEASVTFETSTLCLVLD